MVSVASRPSVVEASLPSSLQELCGEYRRYGLSVRSAAAETVQEELLYLKRFFVYLGPPVTSAALFACIEPVRVTGFLTDYAETQSPGSRRWMQHSLRSFLRFCYDCGHIGRDLSALVPPVRKGKMGHVPRCLPDECIAALEAGIERDTAAGLRDSAIVCLLGTYGVRGIQVRRLRLDHLDWQNERICFPAAKGGRRIEQHLTAAVGNRLADYIADGRPNSDWPEVFLTLTEPFHPLPSASHLSAILHRRMDQLGIQVPEGVSHGSHGFRHAFATRLIGRVPFKDIVDLLGHRDPSSTLIYGKVDLDALRQAALRWPGGER